MITPNDAREFLTNSENSGKTFFGTRHSRLGNIEHIGIQDTDRIRHTVVTGPTGQGKSNLLLSMALQDAQKTGFCFLNPKGGVIRELLAKLPQNRLDDVIYINPNQDRCPAINLLEPETTPDMNRQERIHQRQIVTSATMGLFRRLTEDWGERWPRNLRSLISAHAALNATYGEENTLMDVYQCVTNSDQLVHLMDRVPDPVTRTHLEEVKMLGSREKKPLLRRLADIIENETVRNIVAQPSSDISFHQALLNQKIVLVDAQGGHVGDWAASIIGSVVLSRLWSATAARSSLPPDQHHPFHIYIDEVQEFVSEADHIRRMLSQCREFNVSITAATQYLADLDPTMQRALLNNTATKVVFSPGASQDLSTFTTIMNGLTKTELSQLGQFRPAIQRPAQDVLPPAITVRTYPPWDWEQADADHCIQQLIGQYQQGETSTIPTVVGPGDNAGGEEHSKLLEEAKRWFESEEGAEVRLLYQDPGSEKPDGHIVFQNGDIAHLEAEASTLSKPERVLENLRRAAEQGRECIYVVQQGHAPRLQEILQREDAEYRIYETTDHGLTELGTLSEQDCPELPENEIYDLRNFCLYREDDGTCTELQQHCVLIEP